MVVVLLVGTALAEHAPPARDARALFEAGVNYLQEKPEGRYEEALALFRGSYAQSSNFRVLLPMGICELHLERDSDAIAHFQQYLSQGGTQVPPDLRSQAERDIATLSASLVRVTVRLDPVGATIVDERTPVQGPPIVNRYSVSTPTFTLGIRPGHHKFTVTTENRVSEVWSFEATPGAALSAHFRLEAKPPREASLTREGTRLPRGSQEGSPAADYVPVGEYAGLVATGVLLTGAVVTGLLGHGGRNKYLDLNDARHVSEARKRRDEAGQLMLANDVLLVGALVTGGLTAYFHFSRTSSQAGSRDVAGRLEHDTLDLRAQPELGTQSGRIILSGAF